MTFMVNFNVYYVLTRQPHGDSALVELPDPRKDDARDTLGASPMLLIAGLEFTGKLRTWGES